MSTAHQIRENLRRWLCVNRAAGSDDVLIEELCFLDKKNRADLVHANGSLTAFEIKSAADTLVRWPRQRAAYQQVFDEVWLCFHGKHIAKALASTPADVGLLLADDLGGLAIVRDAKPNVMVDAYHLTGLLWRLEIEDLFRAFGLPGKRGERIKEARIRLAQDVPLRAIQEKVLACLKNRYPHYRPDVSSVSSSSWKGADAG